MLRFYLAGALLGTFSVLSAQTLVATPGILTTCEAEPGAATECFLHFSKTGAADSTLHLKWRRIEVDYPEGWDIDLCDYGACYIGVPPDGIMWPSENGEQPYLKLIIQPGDVPGAGWAVFRVSEVDNPTNFLDVYFSTHTPGVVATFQPNDGVTVRAFPNPTSEFIVLENTGPRPVDVRLVNIAGRSLWQHELPGNARDRLDLPALAPGVYLLHAGGQAQQLIIKN